MEDDLQWKTTFAETQPSMEHKLRLKTTFDWRRPLMEDNLQWKLTFRPLTYDMCCVDIIWCQIYALFSWKDSSISWIDGWTEGGNKEGWEGPHRSSSSGSPLCRIEFSKSFYWFQTAYIQPSNSLRQLPITLHTLTGHPLHTFEASFKHLPENFQIPFRHLPKASEIQLTFWTLPRQVPDTF